MTQTQPQSNETGLYKQVVDLIHAQTQDGGQRYFTALNLGINLLGQCAQHTGPFKLALATFKKEMDKDRINDLNFMLDVCNRFKQAEKQFEKKKGKAE